MCGIILTKNPKALDMIAHRGTEFNQVKWGDWYLGHSRLPIQTFSGPMDPGVQPIKIPGGYVLYNGEIYNYPRGYASDTEYLKALFTEHPDIRSILNAAKDWDGMWAILRVTESSAFAFTDPLGKKQLYYNNRGEICSEILPLVRPKDKIDEFYRSEIFKWGYNFDERTPFERVKRLQPNTYLRMNLDRGTASVAGPWYAWYFPSKPKITGGIDTAARTLRGLIEESVERRMMAKGHQFGVLLSGGLDSSIITSILAAKGADIQIYSVRGNESQYASLMARKLGVLSKVIWIPSDADESYTDQKILEALRYNECPIDLGSLMPQHRMCSVVDSDIIIAGDGSDELFGGYRRIHDYDSQLSDVFQELPYYHLPRLDRAAMRFTKELRSPFLGHKVIRFALTLPYEYRVDKLVLKKAFAKDIPEEILNRPKQPLKSQALLADPLAWRKKLHSLFYDEFLKTLNN